MAQHAENAAARVRQDQGDPYDQQRGHVEQQAFASHTTPDNQTGDETEDHLHQESEMVAADELRILPRIIAEQWQDETGCALKGLTHDAEKRAGDAYPDQDVKQSARTSPARRVAQ